MTPAGPIFPPSCVGDSDICDVELPVVTNTRLTGVEQTHFWGAESDNNGGADVEGAGILDVCNFTCAGYVLECEEREG